MFRTFAVIGAILASTGVAHAQDQIVVNTTGKSPHIVKAELFRAAYAVCSTSTDPLDWGNTDECARVTLDDALRQLHDLQQLGNPTLHTIAAR